MKERTEAERLRRAKVVLEAWYPGGRDWSIAQPNVKAQAFNVVDALDELDREDEQAFTSTALTEAERVAARMTPCTAEAHPYAFGVTEENLATLYGTEAEHVAEEAALQLARDRDWISGMFVGGTVVAIGAICLFVGLAYYGG